MGFGSKEENSGILLVREEVQRDLINSRAGNRAWEFEEKLDEGKESILAKMCLRE